MVEVILFIIFIILALSWLPYILSTGKHGAPYVGMEPEVVQRVMEIAEVGPNDVFYELGSGDGRLVTAAALRGAKAVGIEIDKLRVFYSRLWLKILRLTSHAQIWQQNIFDTNLSPATVICTYLLPETNAKLEEKLKRELKKGSRVVVVSFPFPNWQPEKVDPRGTIYGPIYFYRV